MTSILVVANSKKRLYNVIMTPGGKKMKISDKIKEKQRGEEKRFTLRMDAELFDTISLMASVHKRSVAKEIEYAIELYTNQVLDELVDIQEEIQNEKSNTNQDK